MDNCFIPTKNIRDHTGNADDDKYVRYKDLMVPL